MVEEAVVICIFNRLNYLSPKTNEARREDKMTGNDPRMIIVLENIKGGHFSRGYSSES